MMLITLAEAVQLLVRRLHLFETNVHYYAGKKDNVQEEVILTTIDLSLARRRLMDTSGAAGEPDYRPEIYKTFI